MDIYDIELANRQVGHHFFDVGTKRFFRSRIGRNVYEGSGGVYFVTSEQFEGSNGSRAPRRYTVRRFDPATAHIDTVGEFNVLSAAQAQRMAAKLATGEPSSAEARGDGS